MNCREAERLLDTFYDGELDGRLMRDAALHVTKCRSCERELQAKEAVKNLLGDTIEADVSHADLSSIWAGVEAGLSRDGDAASENVASDAPGDRTRAVPTVGENEASSRPRRLMGRRAGGRRVDTGVQGGARVGSHAGSRAARSVGRRGVGRISAAGVTAVAMGVAAFLVFNVGPEQADEPLLAESLEPGAAESPAVASTTDESSTRETQVVSSKPKAEPKTAIALGPVSPPEPLISEWTGQVQAGPLDYSDHAMSLWRPAAAR